MLSEADLFGQHDGVATNVLKDYTYNGTKLITNTELLKASSFTANYSWMRSPCYGPTSVAMLGYDGTNYSGFYGSSYSVRPALWVTYQ